MSRRDGVAIQATPLRCRSPLESGSASFLPLLKNVGSMVPDGRGPRHIFASHRAIAPRNREQNGTGSPELPPYPAPSTRNYCSSDCNGASMASPHIR